LPKLITADDLRGDLHTHTTASDGVNSIEEMAEVAMKLGYEYLAITDHSKSQVIANGLQPERLLKHVEQIRKVSAKLRGITLLAGAEVDILADGHLDYDDDVLKELDWVVASPHTALKQDEQKATERLLRAIDNRYVCVIGHPTGRLIGARDGLPLDFDRIFKACVEAGTAMEINSGWPRLDLNDVHARGAVAAGVMLSINTDAHATEQLHGRWLGIGVARRAGVEAKHVLNCLSLSAVRAWVARKRR
jgi:DNA polymerase (family 10)